MRGRRRRGGRPRFLFETPAFTWPQAPLILGTIVTACSGLSVLVRFSEAYEHSVREEMVRRARLAMGETDLAREAA